MKSALNSNNEESQKRTMDKKIRRISNKIKVFSSYQTLYLTESFVLRNRLLCIYSTLVLSFVLFACTPHAPSEYALVIHGGAGTIERANMPPEKEAEYRMVLNRVLAMGDSVLKNNGSAIDAVELVIRAMEDSPLFNAGKGAVFANDGTNHLDASLMDGANLNAGAVAGVRTIKNPITAARVVMEQSVHVMLYGEGATAFAKEQGVELVDTSYFFTQDRWDSLQRLLNKERERTAGDNHGTVGCVALDKKGNLAAGTSTGGMTNKKYGRIGDSPVIGAGTYASNHSCAVSCTGHGEYFIRLGFARDVAAQMEYQNLSVKNACRNQVEKLSYMKGTGGVIALDRLGNIAMEFNTRGMYRGYVKANGEKRVYIFNDEED